MTAGKWFMVVLALLLTQPLMLMLAASDKKPGEGWAFLFFIGFVVFIVAWKMMMMNFRAGVMGRAIARELRR